MHRGEVLLGAVLPVSLRHVHRQVGVSEYIVRRVVAGRSDCHADTHAHRDLLVAEQERRSEGALDSKGCAFESALDIAVIQ
jgi:hypothetical protein